MKPRLTKDAVRELAYGRGVPLRVMLTLYRWARAYAEVPGGSGRDARILNATARFSVRELAFEALGSDGRKDVMAIGRAIRSLVRAGVVTVIEDPGKPSIFVPHATGTSLRVPQHMWRAGHLSRRDRRGELALGGQTLLLLVALLSLARLDLKRVAGWRALSPFLQRALTRGLFTQEESIVGLLPFSASQQRRALNALVDAGLVARFRTRGRAMIAVLEPP